MAPAVISGRPIKRSKHNKEKQVISSSARCLRWPFNVGAKNLSGRLMKGARSSRRRRKECKGRIPAVRPSFENVIAKGIHASALEERETIQKSNIAQSAAKPSSFRPSVQLLGLMSRRNKVDNDTVHDLTMKLRSLSSRSSSPTSDRRESIPFSGRVSSVTESSKAASWGLTSAHGRQELVPSQQHRVQRSLTPSLRLRRKSRSARRSVSRGRRRSVDRNVRGLEVVKARYKTSICTSSQSANSGIIGSASRSNSINRTIISVSISPRRDCSKDRHISTPKSRSDSRCDTPIPPNPTCVGGYRPLSSDRDIQDILHQRLTEAPKVWVSNVFADLDKWRPRWNNASIEKDCREGLPRAAPLTKDETSGTRPSATSQDSHQSHTVVGVEAPSIGLQLSRASDATSPNLVHGKVNGSSKSPEQPCLQSTDHQVITATFSDASRKRSLPSTEPNAKRIKVGKPACIEESKIHFTYVPVTSRLECSACIEYGSRCIRVDEDHSSCERCINQESDCVFTILPSHVGDRERQKISRGEAQRMNCSTTVPGGAQINGIPIPHTKIGPSSHHQSDVPSVAARPQDPVPVADQHRPQRPSNPPTNKSSNHAEIGPATAYHTKLQSQQDYGWVKNWDMVQPRRIHPERRHSVQQIPPHTQTSYTLRAPAQQNPPVLLHPQDQRVSVGFDPRQPQPRANSYTIYPPPPPNAVFQPHPKQIQVQYRYQPQPQPQTTGPVSSFRVWGPVIQSRHLPHPQGQQQPQPNQRQAPPRGEIANGGDRPQVIVYQQQQQQHPRPAAPESVHAHPNPNSQRKGSGSDSTCNGEGGKMGARAPVAKMEPVQAKTQAQVQGRARVEGMGMGMAGG